MAPVAEQLALRPTLDEARALASEGHDPIPVRHTFPADRETPVSAYMKLRGAGPSFLLESANERWSVLGVRPRALQRPAGEDPYDAAARVVADARPSPAPDLPRFAGGVVGCFGYDLAAHAEPTVAPTNPDELGLPDMVLLVADEVVAFDHSRREISVVENLHPGGAYADAVERVQAIRDRLAQEAPAGRQTGAPPTLEPNADAAQYAAAVERAKEHIRAGDVYQVVLSRRWSGPATTDAFSTYRALRGINPSPHMFFLDLGGAEILGASPEPLVTVTGRRAEQRPIAGTRPRGATEAEDVRRERELLADEKERAEHTMLVDLARNDLGRVAEAGSVHVDDLMTVERYSHVMHIVSTVSATLKPRLGPLDALRAALPAGTLSGAPKIRAMQIIDDLEQTRRGPYGGAVGYLSYAGDLATAIFIRSAVVKDGWVHVQAGAGIVADSDPRSEARETEAKAAAVFDAIERSCRQP